MDAKKVDVNEALRGLDAGIKRLGPIVSLEFYAIDLEIAAGRSGAALVRLARVEAQAGPQPSKRSAILAASGSEPRLRATEGVIVLAPTNARTILVDSRRSTP